ncbi:neural cell adhesion molecule 2-like [Dermacentor albipictus]|uniref:neural cell adhesion molecule 2-like n=1 Tax=Dermacentor albipictus TaxID=60249 RepID=UPI0031FD4E2A
MRRTLATTGSVPVIGRTLRRMLVFCAVCIWICSVVVHCRIQQRPANKEQPYASIVYTAVAGGKVALPCDISPPSPDDSVTLVLWYKDESLAPIFTLDSRRDHVDQARQSPAPGLERRLFFDMGHSPAHLRIDPVREGDAGEYRCRVDFRRARSVNTVINLKVIVPPGDPVVMDEDGRKLEGLVGRFSEGQNLRLLCEVEGGKPRPVVTWWRDKRLVDSNFSFVGDGSVARNWLEVGELKRSDFLSVLTCQAANNNVTVAVSRSITLDMNLIPLDVAIQPPRHPLSAGHPVELVCSSSGSRPPALLTWWKGDEQLLSAKEHQGDNNHEGTSSSVLLFTPRKADNGAVLSCRAENQFIQGSAIEEGWKLDVFYKPLVSLRLGQNLREDDIREGRDVYLDCDVDANPPANEVTWLFEGQEVTTNTSAGVIVSSQSLVLQKVHRSRRGRYKCIAMNREGHGTSNVFMLRIKYAPVCKPDQRHIYGVSRHESVSVRCELEADPADVTFHWRFNSSSSGKRLELASYSHALTRSTALYSPLNEDDFGLLLCWGANEIGKQQTPCNFTIVPAGPPEPVNNCSQVNGTEDSVSFECSEGFWDGGVAPVTFVAELREADTDRLVANASSMSGPAFSFSGLEGGSTFRVFLFSANPKGHRSPVHFVVSTLRPAEKLTAGSRGMITAWPIIGALLGLIVTLLIAALVIVVYVKHKYLKRKRDTYSEPGDEKSNTLLKKDADEFADVEEKGPDIIPDTPLCQVTYKSYGCDQDEKVEYAKEPLTSYYTLPASTRKAGATEFSWRNHCTNNEDQPLEAVGAELPFPAAARRLGHVGSTSSLPRPQRFYLDQLSPDGSGATHVDFVRSGVLRPLASAHRLPRRSRSNLEEFGPVLSNDSLESTV